METCLSMSKRWVSVKLMILLLFTQSLMACAVPSETSTSHQLSNIIDHDALSELLTYACSQKLDRRASLLIMFSPPESLWSEQSYRCGDDNVFDFSDRRPPIQLPAELFSSTDEQWILEAYRLIQQGTYSLMGEWIHPKNPKEISFLHRAFAKHPYITARLMASAPAPHVGEVWQLLYQHMDRILLDSPAVEDQRLLAFAMARDGREQEAISLIQQLLSQGDFASLYVLPFVTLDTPKPIENEDEMAETTEPELGYQVLAMLENFVYQQNYPKEFCAWAQDLEPGPLANYVATLLVNFQENLPCTEG
ncbi:hypothetical protein [Shewanella litorisediminis]|uniref:Lipoprotein n=1 Tax=Shewanella litorisediminis TaxID=1173586 RepID=A0ABX7G5B2_9GAMM|nr:hypothetical protein [Shewanella litorisediminis]MCL2917374.1 hypothetical protein [Shewanella litorisediminis]QRH02511.1 hypothetical protein JQC75_03550 [Shewanella litorisediminis]